MADPYVWTEIFNCAKIGRKAIETYCKHHAIPVHVYGYEEDLSQIADHPLVRKERLPKRHALSYLKYHFRFAEKALSETELREAFVDGHLGTATLWSFIFKRFPYLELVHFDSDVLFFGEIVETIASHCEKNDLVGPVRPYKNNPCHRDDVRSLPDLVQTVVFGVVPRFQSQRPFPQLREMIRGTYSPTGRSLLDFFDPISLDIVNRGGRVHFLDPDDVGGINAIGSRENKYASFNDFPTEFKMDFGSKLIHFSAAGSGMYYHANPKDLRVPESYRSYAIDRYALYCKAIYDENVGVDVARYNSLIAAIRERL